MRFFLLLMSFVLVSSDVLAIDVKTITKEYSKQMKTIKKRYKCKKIIPIVDANNDFYCFMLKGNGANSKSYGVADASGKLIIPVKYKGIIYLPSVSKGISKVPCEDIVFKTGRRDVTFDLYHEKTQGGFWAYGYQTSDFYDSQGILKMASQDYKAITVLPGYVFATTTTFDGELVHKQKGFVGIGGKAYLLGATIINHASFNKCDGTLIVDSILHVDFNNDKTITYTKKIDGVEKSGLYDICNPNKSIPCLFASINKKNGKYLVKKNQNDDFVEYSESFRNWGVSYRDKGEKLYEQGKWDEVLDFYKNEGINSPWALYISSCALERKGSMMIANVMGLLDEAATTIPIAWLKLPEKAPENFAAGLNCIKTAKKFVDMYLNLGDESYVEKAKDLQRSLGISIEMDEKQYAKYLVMIKNTRKLVKEQDEWKQQLAVNLINGMCNSLIRSLQKTSFTGSSEYKKKGSMSTVSSSDKSATMTTDNSSRKVFLRGQILDWKNKLKKAEDSLEKEISSGEDTREKKRVVESKRKTVNECLEMIRQYEAELNSLK